MLTIRTLQQHMSNRLSLLSLGNLTLRYAFSTILSDDAQQALIAHTALNIIRYFKRQNYLTDSRSIRNLILDRAYFKSRLIYMINPNNKNGLKREEITSQWIDSVFQQKNYQAVLAGFQLDKGAPWNKQIWPQDRFVDEAFDRHIVLFPVSITYKYFQKLSEGKNGILSGTKGTGKSFAFFTFSYLSSFKVKYYVNNLAKENKLLDLSYQKYWKTIKQICYINLKDVYEYKSYYQQIILQFPFLYPKEQVEIDFAKQEETHVQEKKNKYRQKNNSQFKQNEEVGIIQTQAKELAEQQKYKKKLAIMLRNLMKKAKAYNIELVCVIDQANRIFRQFRLLQAILHQNPESKWKQTKQFKHLSFYQELLQIFLKQFEAVILNSSQDFQLKKAQDLTNTIFKNKIDQVPFVKLSCALRNFGTHINIGYAKEMMSNSGKIEQYNILWFNILKHIRRYQLFGPEQQLYENYQRKLISHRKIFEDQFGLNKVNEDNDFTQNLIADWNYEVQHLSIRQAIDSFRSSKDTEITFLKQSSKNIFLKKDFSSQQQKQFRQKFIKLKQYVGKYSRIRIPQLLAKYLSKATSYQEGRKRLGCFEYILEQALQYCKERKKQIKANDYYKYSFKKELELSANEQKILVQSINIGYFQGQFLIFDISPQELVQILCLTLRNKNFNKQVARFFRKLFVDPQKHNLNAELGKLLDRISFPIFQDGKLQLVYTQFIMKGSINSLNYQEPTKKQVCMEIGKTCPIIGINSKQGKVGKVFTGIIELADANYDNNKSQYVGGYPMRKVSNKEQSGINKLHMFQSFVPLENNMLFDSVIVKKLKSAKEGQNAQYDIILYDWTMGRPGSKKDKDFRTSLNYYLNQSNIKADINCKLLIVAPDIFVQQYLEWWKQYRQERDQFQQKKKQKQRKKKTFWNKKEDKQQRREQEKTFGIDKPLLPQLYLAYSFTNIIQNTSYRRNVTVGFASFKYSPFICKENSENSIFISFATQCYELIKSKEIKLLFGQSS